ncbi:TRAP transporter substrate-binding protein [[Clostridium] symbiosum]|uniref:TRAP transporter substrate-binding protein n=1 Tax=Clostridium symbiosum TaxID=1512 RepID=UPI001D08ABFC|nr:TRAP transporter substrate-binding protein [[Clostridium] symbiosum]MCB6610864.1 TRAP transporter substrate-binding protein [[Clostridium] symbiosum]MCB6933341.1 TRAP transporter substrate-binding protein [[Clostridium] symbiosum]
MKKNKFMTACLAAVLGVSMMAGCGSAGQGDVKADGGQIAEKDSSKNSGESGEEKIVMRLAHINSNTDPKQMEAEKFKELVEEKTGGKVQIDIYGAGQLGDVNEIIEGLKLGTNEIVIEGFGTIPSYTQLSLLDLVPFMWRDRDHFDKVWNGELGQELLKEASVESGITLFGPSYRGIRVTTSKKPFHNLAELKGLKIRVPSDDMSVKTWEALGAAPTPMAMNEVLTGIQQGTIEAQENPAVLSYNFGLADACKYLIKTNHRWSADVFMMDQDYFNNLPEEIQTAVLEAGKEAADYVSKINTEQENESFKKWEEAGTEIIVPDDIEEFSNATQNVVKNSFPELTDWVEKIQAVR